LNLIFNYIFQENNTREFGVRKEEEGVRTAELLKSRSENRIIASLGQNTSKELTHDKAVNPPAKVNKLNFTSTNPYAFVVSEGAVLEIY
jgi:hypothetical protein